MARPRINESDYRDRLIAAAEDLLRETGGQIDAKDLLVEFE